jgi:hypothetical protein
MSEVYFDVGAWERDVEERKRAEAAEGEGKKRKRPTKKDLVSRKMAVFSCSFVYFLSGTIQGAEKAEKDSKDRLASSVTDSP